MSEIEKMYKLANIKAINIAKHGSTYIPDSIEINEQLYPPFTAEKQLRLVKLLASYGKYDPTRKLLLQCLDGEWHIAIYEGLDLMSNGAEVDFKKCLARVINKFWQSLSEDEKQQVKGILE